MIVCYRKAFCSEMPTTTHFNPFMPTTSASRGAQQSDVPSPNGQINLCSLSFPF